MNRETMRRFVAAVRSGETPAASDLEAVAQAFEGIEAGADPKAALGVQGQPGRPRKRGSVGENLRRLEAAAEVLARQADGARFEDAVAEVAEAHNRSDETVRTWLKAPDVRPVAAGQHQNMTRSAALIAEADALGIAYGNDWTLRDLRQAVEAASEG